MSSRKSSQKQVRVSERRQLRNKSVRSQCKTGIVKAERLIFNGELKSAQVAVVEAISSLDNAAEKGIIHPNNAARRKARLMKKLNWPTLFCNNLVIADNGSVADYNLRQKNGKFEAVKALKSIGYGVIAAGDSYNDVTMLKEADHGIFFRPPEGIVNEYPEFPVTNSYDELLKEIEKVL